MWTPRRVHCPSLQGSECLRPSCPGSRAAARAPPASPFPLCYGNTTLENRGGCEAGDDTQRQPRAAGTLQDLSQGSREGVREAAGLIHPTGGCKGLKAAASSHLQGGTGLLPLSGAPAMPRMNLPENPSPPQTAPHFPLIPSPPLTGLRHISCLPLSHTLTSHKVKFLSPGFREDGARGKQIHEDPQESLYPSPATGLWNHPLTCHECQEIDEASPGMRFWQLWCVAVTPRGLAGQRSHPEQRC